MIGGWEWVIILVVIALLLFGGSKKIPEFARGLGKARGELERGKLEVEKEMREMENELKETGKGIRKAVKEPLPLIKLAEEMGIETKGKSNEELRHEIVMKGKGK